MSAEKPLAGRVALVTGASRGVGRAIALALAGAGARVVVNYRRDAEAARAVLAELRAAGGEAIAVQASVADPEQLAMLAAEAERAYGAVDLLVHNAGIASQGLPVLDTSYEELVRVVATHAFAAHRLAALLLPKMRARPRGDVIVISSMATEGMQANGAPYNMAKAALEAFARTLAKEERRHGIRVNIVAPGLVNSDMGDRLVRALWHKDSVAELDAAQPFGHVTRPEDIAKVVLFLVSDQAALVTGQRIGVDGGMRDSPLDVH
jgi:NAD(P)-dependent dehydrogenase (short-subunit alcohol dehydrogenase family)